MLEIERWGAYDYNGIINTGITENSGDITLGYTERELREALEKIRNERKGDRIAKETCDHFSGKK